MSDDSPIETAVESWKEAKASGDTLGQHIAKIFASGVGLADPVMGAIASLGSTYIPYRRRKRLEEFVEQIAEDLKRVRDFLDATYVRSDEFAFIFEHCLRGVGENYHEEKVAAFRGILVNSPIRKDVRGEEKEYFLSLVVSLTPLHLRMLRFMADPRGYLAAAGITESSIQGGFKQFFPVAIPGVRIEVLQSAFSDLHRMDMINTPASIFNTMTSGQGLQLLGGRVTPLGNLFAEFITTPGFP